MKRVWNHSQVGSTPTMPHADPHRHRPRRKQHDRPSPSACGIHAKRAQRRVTADQTEVRACVRVCALACVRECVRVGACVRGVLAWRGVRTSTHSGAAAARPRWRNGDYGIDGDRYGSEAAGAAHSTTSQSPCRVAARVRGSGRIELGSLCMCACACAWQSVRVPATVCIGAGTETGTRFRCVGVWVCE